MNNNNNTTGGREIEMSCRGSSSFNVTPHKKTSRLKKKRKRNDNQSSNSTCALSAYDRETKNNDKNASAGEQGNALNPSQNLPSSSSSKKEQTSTFDKDVITHAICNDISSQEEGTIISKSTSTCNNVDALHKKSTFSSHPHQQSSAAAATAAASSSSLENAKSTTASTQCNNTTDEKSNNQNSSSSNSFLQFVATKNKTNNTTSIASKQVAQDIRTPKGDGKKEALTRTLRSSSSSSSSSVQNKKNNHHNPFHRQEPCHGESRNQNYPSPLEILQLPCFTSKCPTTIATTINSKYYNYKSRSSHDKLSQEEKYRQEYYNPTYYSAIVEHYITNDFYQTTIISSNEQNQNDKRRDDNPKEDEDKEERAKSRYVVYNHPILGDVNLDLMEKGKVQNDHLSSASLHYTTNHENFADKIVCMENRYSNDDRHFLVFPNNEDKRNTHYRRRYNQQQEEDNQNQYLLGSNIDIKSLLFSKIHNKGGNKTQQHHHHNLRTNLPIPMKTEGKLKIISFQGATVRTNFEIDDGMNRYSTMSNKKLCILSKNDVREFVDVKWLSPYTTSRSSSTLYNDNYCIQMEDSSSDKEDEDRTDLDSSVNGVFRYKVKLLDEDLSQGGDDGSTWTNYNGSSFGWISDRSRLKDKPYWIAIVL